MRYPHSIVACAFSPLWLLFSFLIIITFLLHFGRTAQVCLPYFLCLSLCPFITISNRNFSSAVELVSLQLFPASALLSFQPAIFVCQLVLCLSLSAPLLSRSSLSAFHQNICFLMLSSSCC